MKKRVRYLKLIGTSIVAQQQKSYSDHKNGKIV